PRSEFDCESRAHRETPPGLPFSCLLPWSHSAGRRLFNLTTDNVYLSSLYMPTRHVKPTFPPAPAAARDKTPGVQDSTDKPPADLLRGNVACLTVFLADGCGGPGGIGEIAIEGERQFVEGGDSYDQAHSMWPSSTAALSRVWVAVYGTARVEIC